MKGKVVNVNWKLIQERRSFFGTHLIFPEQKYSNAPSQIFCPQAEVEMRRS